MYTGLSTYHIVQELEQSLRSKPHSKLVIVVGSVLSRGAPTLCPDAPKLRSLVLNSLADSYPWKNERTRSAAIRLRGDPRVGNIPFEQFMGCLYQADQSAALKLVETAYGDEARGPVNVNHEYVFELAKSVLDKKLVTSVTILTTNYDTCIETALELVHSQWYPGGGAS